MPLKLKRVYLKPDESDGYRVLVDRLWPRGLSKRRARMDLWLKEVAPSTRLRKWYGHEPGRWSEFKRRYRAELKQNPAALGELRALLRRHRSVTLLFSSKEERLNNAAALKSFLR